MYLHCDVESGDVEALEHDLGRVLAVLRRVQWRLGQQEVVVLRLGSEVLEDALLPESLHEVPVLHNAVANRVLGGIADGVSLVPDVEIWWQGKIVRRKNMFLCNVQYHLHLHIQMYIHVRHLFSL